MKDIKLYFLFFCLFFFVSSFAQVKHLQGIVLNAITKRPIVNAYITFSNGEKKIYTNVKGDFFFIFKDIPYTIQVANEGFITQSFFITSTTKNLTVELSPHDRDSTVPTALDIYKTKDELTYNNTVVSGATLMKVRTNNMMSTLEGKVSGLSVSTLNTGLAASVKVLIRGTTSTNPFLSNQPLYVVDGVPLNNIDGSNRSDIYTALDGGDGIQLIDPHEIKTFTVLKGASAAALYGFRASNGVILITTKGSELEGMVVDAHSTTSIETPYILPKWQYQYGQGMQYGNALVGSAPQNPQQVISAGLNSWGGALNGQPVLQYDGQYRPYTAQKDRFNFYQLGSTFINGLSISGGKAKYHYFVDVADTRSNGIVPTSRLVRDNVSFNFTADPTKKLNVQLLVKYLRNRITNRPIVNAAPGNANFTIAFMPTSWNQQLFKTNQFGSNRLEIPFTTDTNVTNPYLSTSLINNTESTDRVLTNLNTTFKVNKDIYVRGRFTADYYASNFTTAIPIGVNYFKTGGAGQVINQFTEINGEGLLGYKHTFWNKFSVDAFIAGNILYQSSNAYSIAGPLATTLPIFFPSNLLYSYTQKNLFNQEVASTYGFVELGYKNYLYLSFSGRNDWFSTVSLNKNSFFYPSVGLNFIPTHVWKLPSYIDELKFVASFSQVGGGVPAPYTNQVNYQMLPVPFQVKGSPAVLGGNIPFVFFGGQYNGNASNPNILPLVNPNVVPYTLNSFEIGEDILLLKNRLGFAFNYYYRLTSNDLVTTYLPSTAGYLYNSVNIGKVLNQGVELDVNARPISYKGFAWDISYNFSYNQNKVLQLYNNQPTQVTTYTGASSFSIQNIQGLAAGQIMVTNVAKDPATGKILTNNGLPVATGLQAAGTGVPPYMMGLQNEFSYKGIFLSFLIDAKFGGVFYSATNAIGTGLGLTTQTLAYRGSGLVVNGIDQKTGLANTIPVSAQQYWGIFGKGGGAPNIPIIAGNNVYSSDFIKLREIVLGYQLPIRYLHGSPIRGIDFSISARNVALIKSWVPNVDPEAFNAINAQGIEYVGVPSTTSVAFNLHFKL